MGHHRVVRPEISGNFPAANDRRRRMERRYVGISDASAYLGMSQRWMYRESRKHGIPRYYFGGRLKFRIDDLDRWAQQQKTT
ncbi:helix-turn-helix domain-containing protein [Streptomyces globisporus]|uniref:helix-turn-helix domain-containing protein n=2 Tax=Streptomyces griseus group TaxID=629295 RepID=UPI0036B90DD8